MGEETKYIVRLTDEERHTLQQMVVGPRVARAKALRARMLLKADVDGPHWHDGQIVEAFDVGGVYHPSVAPAVRRGRAGCCPGILAGHVP
jgi:hypothetical protein